MDCSLQRRNGTQKNGKVESSGKKLYWNWEHRMRTENTHRRPDLTLEDTTSKTILLIDMACPIESNKDTKPMNKITRYRQLCFELRKRREGFTVNVILTIIGYLGGGIKELKESLKRIFENDNDKELESLAREMEKTVLWESESLMRKAPSGLLT